MEMKSYETSHILLFGGAYSETGVGGAWYYDIWVSLVEDLGELTILMTTS